MLDGGSWEFVGTEPGAVGSPTGLPTSGWLAADVPGTVAASLPYLEGDLDDRDWWFRCPVSTPTGNGPWLLRAEGLATIADVWVGDRLVLQTENMFRAYHAVVDGPGPVTIRFAALGPLLAQRRPRPRWKASIVRQQNLRWFRTTLLGRMPGVQDGPAPVGPWRPITLTRLDVPVLVQRRYEADPATGVVSVDAVLRCATVPASVRLATDGAAVDAAVIAGRGEVRVRAALRIPAAEPWWPHTHGAQPLYPMRLFVDGVSLPLGSVGFRSVEADRDDGGFALRVNGVPVFCRGACWVPADPVSLNPSPAELRSALTQLRDAGMNMVRVTGTTYYESDEFYALCDELGMLVWQDAMLATLDLPADDDFVAELSAEVREVCARLSGHPSVAVLSGGSESEQQPAMLGLLAEGRELPLQEQVIRKLVEQELPNLPYVTSTPTGGMLAFRPSSGVAHYFGVGAYLRPVAEIRGAGVRFAAECLTFAIPPERATVDLVFGSARVAGHHPDWKRGVPRDCTAPWDFEDVRDHYVRALFDVDPVSVRWTDPERYLDLGRAAVAEVMRAVFVEWRRPGSPCAGGLILSARDLVDGAGWGLIDARGVPKAPWYALRRLLAPVAVFITDDGMDGLTVHAVNDTAVAVSARLELSTFAPNGAVLAGVARDVVVPAHGGLSIPVDELLGCFRDVNHAYRFGPPTVDVVQGRLIGDDLLSEDVLFPLGQARPVEQDLGLSATAEPVDAGWRVTVSTRRAAQWVALDVPGTPSDSWFHLPPGGSREVLVSGSTKLRGTVRALNAAEEVRIG